MSGKGIANLPLISGKLIPTRLSKNCTRMSMAISLLWLMMQQESHITDHLGWCRTLLSQASKWGLIKRSNRSNRCKTQAGQTNLIFKDRSSTRVAWSHQRMVLVPTRIKLKIWRSTKMHKMQKRKTALSKIWVSYLRKKKFSYKSTV